MDVQIMDGVCGMATGFVIAFLLTVSYQMTTGRPLSFALEDLAGSPLALLAIMMRIVAGPAILAQYALVQSVRGHTSWGAFGIPAACLWSMIMGTLLLQIITEFQSF